MSMSQVPELCLVILLILLLSGAFILAGLSILLGIVKLIEKVREYKEMFEQMHRWVNEKGFRLECEVEELKRDRAVEG